MKYRRKTSEKRATAVIDLFAGPGGLGEGFSAYRGRRGKRFSIALSIEKDAVAHSTLLLRSFKRQFRRVPEAYYARLRGEITTSQLFEAYPDQADRASREAVCMELSPKSHVRTDRLVETVLAEKPGNWVLIGGPPCQAYSLVGRSRMKGADAAAYERDGRHYLYREYLRILRKFQPPIFVMENVKGILSSTVDGIQTFQEIVRDLKAAGYTLHSFVSTGSETDDPSPGDYVIRSEDYGIPQRRHRVIVLGLRKGLARGEKVLAQERATIPIDDAIRDLPKIRSGLTGAHFDEQQWRSAVESTARIRASRSVGAAMPQLLRNRSPKSLGGDFLPKAIARAKMSGWLQKNSDWFLDRRVGGVLQHAARSHMYSDIQRYFFAACYAKVHGRSPKLAEFPRRLWPAHRNAQAAANGKMFSDRFRVQTKSRPATTVVSHIAKDGHYYIHYDPVQCRSLTVREAARLQTFPDNYFFAGARTDQYHQVGNAVPPLLARQLAAIVADILAQLD